MAIISNLRNWFLRRLDYLIPFLLILIWLTLLVFGTFSITYEKNSDTQFISIQLTELLKSINKSAAQNVHFICKDEQQTYVVHLSTCSNSAKSLTEKRITYRNYYPTKPFSILLYERTIPLSQSKRSCPSNYFFPRTSIRTRSLCTLSRQGWLGSFRPEYIQSCYPP